MWSFLIGLGLYVRNYTAARLDLGFELKESHAHAFTIVMENEEIQNVIAMMMKDGFHAFAMGGA